MNLKQVLNIILVVLLFLQITDTYKIILLLIGKKTVFFSTLTLVYNIFYITVFYKEFFNILKNKIFKLWFWLIFSLPIFINSIHLVINNLSVSEYIYWVSFISFVTSLFVTSVLYFSKQKNLKITNRFLFYCTLSIVISVIIGFYNYDFFRLLMTVSSVQEETAFITSESERSIGFYTQSNILARAALFFLVLYSGTYLFNNKFAYKIFYIVLFLIVIIFSGSRTVLLLSLLFLLYFFPRLFFPKSYLNNASIKSYRLKRILLTITIPFFAILLFSLFSFLIDSSSKYVDQSVTSRFLFVTNFDSSSLDEDSSVNIRKVLFVQYFEKILESPFIGHSPAERSKLVDLGYFSNASQNQYLEDGVAYGIFYVLFYIGVIFYSIRKVKTDIIIFGNKILNFKIFLIIIIIYGFSVNYLLINRLFLIILGCFIGLYIAHKNESQSNSLHSQT